MPVFEIEAGGKTFDVDAPNQQAALDAFAKFSAPAAPERSFGEALSNVFANPSENVPGQVSIPIPGIGTMKPSIAGMLKSAFEGVKGPGQALKGEFNLAPPGLDPNSEEAAYYQRLAAEKEAEAGSKGAAAIMGGAMPGGFFGAPKGALGMGMASPGHAGSAPLLPTAARAPTADVIEAATRQGIEIPRYIADEGRLTQGLAAGLQNVPGAGDAIAQAAAKTSNQLGVAVGRAEKGFGAGSPSIAGGGAKDAMADYLTTGSKQTADRIYEAVDQHIRSDVRSPLISTSQAAQAIERRRAESRLPRSSAVDIVGEALTAPGGMTFQGIKGLRSYLGELTPEALASKGLQQSEVKQLYGALTNDLRNAAQNAGGSQGLAAFDRANRIYADLVERQQSLSKIIGAKGDAAPEAVFARLAAMAGTRSTGNLIRLTQARKVMGADAWNEVAAGVINKLGRDNRGDFSIQRFLTGYGNLSADGKRLLFKSTGRDQLGAALEDIHFVSKEIEAKLMQFHNPSGTAKSLTATGTVMDVIHAPIRALSTLIGGTRMARILSEPNSARATADWLASLNNAIKAPSAGKSKATRDAADKLAEAITGGQSRSEAAAMAAELQSIAAAVNPEGGVTFGPTR